MIAKVTVIYEGGRSDAFDRDLEKFMAEWDLELEASGYGFGERDLVFAPPDPEGELDEINEDEPAKPLVVKILWGLEHEPDDRPTTYEFKTPEELQAFMDGVDEAYGWLYYEIIEHPDDENKEV